MFPNWSEARSLLNLDFIWFSLIRDGKRTNFGVNLAPSDKVQVSETTKIIWTDYFLQRHNEDKLITRFTLNNDTANSFDWSFVSCWNNIISVTKYLLFRCFHWADEDIHEDARTWQGSSVSGSLQSVMWTRQTDGCRSPHVMANMETWTKSLHVQAFFLKNNQDLFYEMKVEKQVSVLLLLQEKHVIWDFI